MVRRRTPVETETGRTWVWDQCRKRGTAHGSCQIQCSTYHWVRRHHILIQHCQNKPNQKGHAGLAPCYLGDTTMNNTDPTTKTLRIWKNLSLQESAHLIGTNATETEIGKKEEAEEASKVFYMLWLPESSLLFTQVRVLLCWGKACEWGKGQRAGRTITTTGDFSRR